MKESEIMNLKQLANINSSIPPQKIDGGPPHRIQRVTKTDQPRSNNKINNPQSFQNAKTHNAQQFQEHDSMQGQLSNLALLSGDTKPEPKIQRVKHNQPAASSPKGLGALFNRIKKSATQSATSPQMTELAKIPTQQPTPVNAPPPAPQVADIPATPKGQYVSDANIKLYATRHQALMKSMFKNAPQGSKLQRYTTIMKLLGYLKQAEKGRGPLANDPQARAILKLRLEPLKAELLNLARDPSIKAAFAKVSLEAKKSALGQDPKVAAKSFADHLTGPDFAQRLQNLKPEQQKALIKKELSKLSLLDSSLVPGVIQKFAERGIAQKTLHTLQQGGSRGQALEQKLETAIAGQVTSGLTDASKASKVAQGIVKIIKAIKIDDLNDLSKIKALISNMPEDQQKSMMRLLEKADFNMSKLLAGLGIVGGVVGLVTADSTEGKLSAGSALLDAGANLGSVLSYMNKAASTGLAASKYTKLLAKGLEFLGPIGDAMALVSDSMGLMREQKNEDIIGQASKWLSVASGGLGAAAGSYMLALGALSLETGPGAPIVLAIGTVGGLAALAVDHFFAESATAGEIRQDLRSLGISDKEDRVGKETTRLNFSGLNAAEISQKLRGLSLADKARTLNYLMDEVWVTPKQEKMIFNILMDVKSPQDFLALTQKLDMSQIAGNIEDQADSLKLFKRMLKASKAVGKPPGKAIEHFLTGLSKNNRTATIQHIFQDKEVQALLSKDQLAHYKAIAKPVLAQASAKESWVYSTDATMEQLRKDLKTALPDQKADYINREMNRYYVKGNRETLMLNVLKDTQGTDLLKVLKKIDTGKLASHLETDSQAIDLAKHILQTYKNLKLPVGQEFKDYLRQLAVSGRTQAVKAILALPGMSNGQLIRGRDLTELKTLTRLGSAQVNKHEGTLYTNQAEFDKIRQEVKGLSTPKQQASAIYTLLNRTVVKSIRETAVYDILSKDIPLNKLPELLNELNVKQVAHELENDNQVVALALRFAHAYKQAGLSNIDKLEDFVKQLSVDKRDAALKKIFADPALKQSLSPAQITRLKQAAARPEETISKHEGYLYTSSADFKKIRADVKHLSPALKARAIKQLMNVSIVTASRETLIKEIILDTPKEQLPELFSKLDATKVISHLETDSEAAAVLKHLLAGYHATGKKIDTAFEGLLTKLTQAGRPGPILELLNTAKDLKPSLVQSLSSDAFKALMLDLPDNAAGKAVRNRIAIDSSWKQANQFIESLSDYQVQNLIGKLDTNTQKMLYSWATFNDRSVSVKTRQKIGNAMVQNLKAGGSGAAELARDVVNTIKSNPDAQLSRLPKAAAQALYKALNDYLNGYWIVSSPPQDMKDLRAELKKTFAL